MATMHSNVLGFVLQVTINWTLERCISWTMRQKGEYHETENCCSIGWHRPVRLYGLCARASLVCDVRPGTSDRTHRHGEGVQVHKPAHFHPAGGQGAK